MRFPFLLATSALVCGASAQTVVVGSLEETIKEAYRNLRTLSSQQSFIFEMKGTDQNGNTTIPVRATLFWRRSYDPRTGGYSRAQAEVDIYEADRLTTRIVGDGTSLYRYDIAKKEVSTTTYGFYGNVPPPGYPGSDVPKLLSQLRAVTPGLAAYLVRVITEMNPEGPDGAIRYANWLPGRPIEAFDTVPMPLRNIQSRVAALHFVTDPVTLRRHFRNDSNLYRYVFMGMDSVTTNRTVVFRLFNNDPSAGDGTAGSAPFWVVNAVYVAQRSPGRVVDLTITPNAVTANLLPAWAFGPYGGAEGAAFRPTNRGN